MRPFLAPAATDDQQPSTDVRRRVATPTFSVIMAVYQGAHLVAEAIESALAQTVPAHEIVVCDDGSTDGLEAALAPYRDRIVLVRQDNGGEGSAKATAAGVATGDFVVILDADDTYLPERIEALTELAVARPDLDLLTTDAFVEVHGDAISRFYGVYTDFETDDQRTAIVRANFVFSQAAIRRSRLLSAGSFDPSMRTHADWECWVRLILGGARAGMVDVALSRYRMLPGNMTSDRIRMLRSRVETLRRACAHPSLDDAERLVAAAALRHERLKLAHNALERRHPDTRRLAVETALDADFPFRTRLKAASAALVPGLARRLALRAGDLTLDDGFHVALRAQPLSTAPHPT